ncbi:putative microtubule-associated protein [Paratrimastix pyriformis]|uniref:Microtubule-associated protein n=1 Tax=Paratrimastix pyriformis TaxID=342808 RepID=A0ABQ8UXW9_9EUKA|nr:putative microtubule-associated protein [Paratrimastix pyriformis]
MTPDGGARPLEGRPDDPCLLVPGLGEVGAALTCAVTVRASGRDVVLNSVPTPPIAPAMPRVVRLAMEGAPAQGAAVTLTWAYIGGREGASIIRWYRLQPLRPAAPPPSAPSPSPAPPAAPQSAGSTLSLALSADSAHGADADAEGAQPEDADRTPSPAPAPPSLRALQEAFVTLALEGAGPQYAPRLEDVGYRLAAEYTPVRADGVVGVPALCLSAGPVAPGAPEILQASLAPAAGHGEPTEGGPLVASWHYRGGREGPPAVVWWRVLGEAAQVEVGRGREYVPQRGDIGYRLRVSITPVRADGLQGPEAIRTTEGPVRPAPPRFMKPPALHVTQPGPGMPVLHCEAPPYMGGEAAAPIVRWERWGSGERQAVILEGVTGTYEARDEDLGARFRCLWTPVRSDGVRGDETASPWCEPLLKLLPPPPPPPSPEKPAVAPPAQPILTGVAPTSSDAPEEAKPLVMKAQWDPAAPEGMCTFQWYRQPQGGTGFVTIPGATEPQYTPVKADVGAALRCVGLVGGAPMAAHITPPVIPAPPVLSNVALAALLPQFPTGSIPAGTLMRPVYRYLGGNEGCPRVVWYRLRKEVADGSQPVPEQIPEMGTNQIDYRPNVCDVGHYIRASVTPIRKEDGMEGPTAHVQSPFTVAPAEDVWQATAKYVALAPKKEAYLDQLVDPATGEARLLLFDANKLKVRTGRKKTLAKAAWSPSMQLMGDPATPADILVHLDGRSAPMRLRAASPEQRAHVLVAGWRLLAKRGHLETPLAWLDPPERWSDGPLRSGSAAPTPTATPAPAGTTGMPVPQ